LLDNTIHLKEKSMIILLLILIWLQLHGCLDTIVIKLSIHKSALTILITSISLADSDIDIDLGKTYECEHNIYR